MGLGWYAEWEREKEEREEEMFEEEERKRQQLIEENKKNDVAILKTQEQFKLYECENGQFSLFPPIKIVKSETKKTAKKDDITKREEEKLSTNESDSFVDDIEI